MTPTGRPEVGAAPAGLLRVPGTLWWVTNLRGVLLRAGPTTPSVLGMPASALVGRRIAELVHASDVSLLLNANARLRAGDEITGVRVRMRHGDGSWLPVVWTARHDPVRDAVLAAGRVADAGHDVGGGPESRLGLVRAVLQHMPAPVFVKDAGGRYLMVNWEFCRLSGLRSPDEAVGRLPAELWPDHAEVIARTAGATAAGGADPGAANLVEVRVPTADGVRDFLVSSAAVRDATGAAQAVVGVATDITVRAAAERRLAERDRVLDAIMQTSPDLIAVLDRAGAVVEHNAGTVGLLGHGASRAGLEDLTAMVHPDDRAAVSAALADMLHGDTPDVVIRYRIRRGDGRWVTVDSRGRAQRDEHGNVTHVVVVTRDVTAALAAESDLRAAVVAAERASLAKSEFLSRMSHELRTPLNSILGFAQLLQMDDLADAQAAAAGEILGAGRRLLSLIDGVLDIARIETGHLDLRPASIPVGAALAGVGGTSGVAVDVAEELPAVWADPRRLEQVLATLVDAARQGDPGAAVTLRATGPEPGWVRIAVESAASPRPSAAVTGDGVALALARYLASQMGGRLTEVREPAQRPGAGSGAGAAPGGLDPSAAAAASRGDEVRFVLEVPARPMAASDELVGEPLPEATAKQAEADRRWGGERAAPMRVLVVAADRAVAQLVRQVSALRAGTEVVVAEDGEEAADALRKLLPDLVVVELPPAGAADPSAMAAVRALAGPGGPVVAVVGSDPASDQARRVLEDGVDAYLALPLDARALLELVDAARGAKHRG